MYVEGFDYSKLIGMSVLGEHKKYVTVRAVSYWETTTGIKVLLECDDEYFHVLDNIKIPLSTGELISFENLLDNI